MLYEIKETVTEGDAFDFSKHMGERNLFTFGPQKFSKHMFEGNFCPRDV